MDGRFRYFKFNLETSALPDGIPQGCTAEYVLTNGELDAMENAGEFGGSATVLVRPAFEEGEVVGQSWTARLRAGQIVVQIENVSDADLILNDCVLHCCVIPGAGIEIPVSDNGTNAPTIYGPIATGGGESGPQFAQGLITGGALAIGLNIADADTETNAVVVTLEGSQSTVWGWPAIILTPSSPNNDQLLVAEYLGGDPAQIRVTAFDLLTGAATDPGDFYILVRGL